ncbi:uncharacterized protein zgc:136858 [Hypanus sabinus]|uniref:uncharacterized protein zgc:136858 n=1 Tax=Hypanus sabinus TaxID=79690 RepID=UPI0028C49FF6|nr:uncharacterized protein zgc:136858 [Hypanus sabinus]XP_059834072.1 uncharacterized protein zgc:136858 [Hypanus sabinus]
MWKFITLFPRAAYTQWGCAVARRLLHDGLLKVHPEVSKAIASQKAVVALESTVITHGMPYPQNLKCAREVEQIVKEHNAVPATIGIIEGKVHVGLSESHLEQLAKSKETLKVSRRDLPYVLSKGLSGGTTVSVSIIAAHKAGIPLLVTGGIGGVHRDGQNTLDISSDLTELGHTPVAVVSAGVKSILDIGRTLEYLETQGVCVATFGKTRDFPAFFTPRSGFQSPYNVTDEEEAARLIATVHHFGQDSGVLIGVPIPEEEAASGLVIDNAISQAVKEARVKGIQGKDVTPFILARICELTQGVSLTTNIALIKNNAKVGSRVACALARQNTRRYKRPSQLSEEKDRAPAKPVVIGGCNIDYVIKVEHGDMMFGGPTNRSIIRQSIGGVGRNLADCLSRLGLNPLFISAIGTDINGETIRHFCGHMDTSGVAILPEHNSAVYCAVIAPSGELNLGLGDMDIHLQITAQYVSKFEEQIRSASFVCLDGNIPASTINYVCNVAKECSVPVLFEPTDFSSACKPFKTESWKSLTYTSPNLMELWAMNQALGLPVPTELPSAVDEVVEVALRMSRPLLKHLQCVIVTLGKHGVLLCSGREDGEISLQPRKASQTSPSDLCAAHYPAISIRPEEMLNVSGAGDSFAAGLIAGILTGQETHTCVRMGLLAASHSIRSLEVISTSININSVNPQRVIEGAWPQPIYNLDGKAPANKEL